MARGAAQARRKRTKAEAKRRRARAQASAAPRAAGDTMFFPKLRQHAKWVFVFLAVVFAGGFVIFGVGSGGGVGLGDLFSNNSGSSNQPSVSEAQKEIAANPRNAAAYNDLASAYETEGRIGPAIAALNHYVQLRPKNRDALTRLANLYATRATRAQNNLAAVQQEAAVALVNTPFELNLLSPKKKPVLTPPAITQAITTRLNSQFTALSGEAQKAFANAEGTFKRLSKLTSDPQIVLQLAQIAQQAGDVKTALASYKRFVKLAPGDPTVPLVKQQIRALKAQRG